VLVECVLVLYMAQTRLLSEERSNLVKVSVFEDSLPSKVLQQFSVGERILWWK